MGVHGVLLLGALIVAFSDIGWTSPAGTEFITSFLQNGANGLSGQKCLLRISGLHDQTTVNVAVIGGSFNTTFPINSKNALTLNLPENTEVRGSGIFKKTVYIKASHPIVVLLLHEKFRTAETTVLLPISSLGTTYYLYTPKTGSSGSSKVFSVLATEETTVEIYTKGFIQMNGKGYKPNDVITMTLSPLQGVQLLSPENLSGSKVVANKPVAVLSGHTCAQKNTKCNHVFEQLFPVSSWGYRYFVAPVLSQTNSDTVAVIAAEPTEVIYTSGDKQEKQNMVMGQVLELDLLNKPLNIEANREVQVIFLSSGGKAKRYEYAPFMMNVLDMDSYCSAYAIFGQRSIDNYFTIIAENTAIEGITIDMKTLIEPEWKSIQGTELSWLEYNYGSSATSHRIEHPSKKFGLQSFGINSMYSYGSIGACVKDPGPPPPTCRNTVCPSHKVCVIENGKPACVKPQVDICWASGDPHLKTFDTMYYDFMGTCTYTFSKVCGEVDKDLHTFSVQIKNDNRGNVKVSYVGQVTLQTGGHTIVIKKGDYAFVRVDNCRRQLPISLLNGTLTIFQSGFSAIIQLGNDMMMSYDWNHYLWLELTRRYAGKMCGMCGNYNQNSADDFLTPSGTQAANPIALGTSWVVEDGTFCWHDCRGPCLGCPSNTAQQYTTDDFCGLISKGNGPFGACHSVVDPKMYMDNCVFDVCVNSGYKLMACQAVSAYADACQRAGAKITSWRSAAGCPFPCPPDSIYNFCGSACPATCDDPDGVPMCTDSCVETCECNSGFVLSHGKCIPKTNCGCKFNGFTYSPNEEFWNDNKCQQRCVCNPQTQKVECKTSSCRAGEECTVKNGILDCYPMSYGVCVGFTDPHYILFDGTILDFQGTCVYLLVGLSDHSRGLTDFQVRVLNQNRGNVRVSYTSAVYIRAYGTEIEVNRQHPNKFIVNNTLQNLPYNSADGQFSFYRGPSSGVFSFSFGLQVTYDYNSVVRVSIPGTYANAVSGLCGNFNKNPNDDLIPKGGKTITDPTTFGKSWKVAEVLKCRDDGNPVCNNLSSEEKRQREGGTECGVMVNLQGPFRDCHALVNPQPYFSSCVYDSCIVENRQSIFCAAISTYMEACQAAGINVKPWRRQDFCPPPCPVHSTYEVCADPCPVTCNGLSTPDGCSGNCTEGCVCNNGFILSGGVCVPISQCGCSYNGAYYSLEESLYVEETCSQKCTCTLGGIMKCIPSSCSANEECRIEKAVLGCHPLGSATCNAAGCSNYRSFDGLSYKFQGKCSYVLAESCSKASSGSDNKLDEFRVTINQTKQGSSSGVIETLMVETNGFSLTLKRQRRGVVEINKISTRLPATLLNGKVRAECYGKGTLIKTSYGLQVRFDHTGFATVTVPGNYKNNMCGLCGNYNGKVDDDGPATSDLAEFANKWKAAGETGDKCGDCGSKAKPCSTCPDEKKIVFSQKNYCGIISDPSGPFAKCHSLVNPVSYVDECISDLCQTNGEDSNVLCSSVYVYADACRQAEVMDIMWRTDTFCPLICGPHSQYSVCADMCSTTCAALSDIYECSERCDEGCECDKGYVFDGSDCLPLNQCGCYHNGVYYQANEAVLNDDCSQECTCNPISGVSCRNKTCSENEKCQILDGVRACVSSDPCKSKTCRTKESCKVQDGLAVCVPDYTGVCTAWGDPHFSTFDGKKYDAQGTCTYILAQCSSNSIGLEPFKLTTKNENRGSKEFSYVKTVEFTMHNIKVAVQVGEFPRIRVNGELTNLPATLADGKLKAYRSGFNAILEVDNGVVVTFDWNWSCTITIPSSYYSLVSGLCGNFNQDPDDDHRALDGTLIGSITDLLVAWKENDQDPFCFDSCPGQCSGCDEKKKSKYREDNQCGLIVKEDGPFRECIKKVSPSMYFESCLFDVCANEGAKAILCEALNTYATKCINEGITLNNWRSLSDCPKTCEDPNSHYTPCGSACPASCSDRTAPSTCKKPCVESCECNEGMLLSGGKCVPIASCGCQFNGRYYEPNQSWYDEKCTVLCKCDPGLGMVVCEPTSCKTSEACMVSDGKRGCYATQHTTCMASGASYYTTFDKLRFNVTKTCIYQLVKVTSNDPSLVKFSIIVQNEHQGNKAASSTKEVTLQVFNKSITFSKEFPLKIKVDGQFTCLPYYYESTKIAAYISGFDVVLVTDFNLKVTFNKWGYVRVILPSTYTGAVSGLCGNNNGDPSDDFNIGNGVKPETEEEFVDNWKVEEAKGCTDKCTECQKCTDADKNIYKNHDYCGILIKADGPFSQCHASVDPTPFFEDCTSDACAYNGHQSVICKILSSYVSECQKNGSKIKEWRTPSFCEMTCPSNSHYELLGNGCPATCFGLIAPPSCVPSYTEGCYCDNGFILSGEDCVSVAECGCTFENTYYKVAQEFFTDNLCQRKCTCGFNGITTCQDSPCEANTECKVVDGALGCHPKEFGQCVAWGDPHFKTPDGLYYSFQGTCTYKLLKTNKGNNTIEVIVDNEPYGDMAVTKSVTVKYGIYTIHLERERTWSALINGERYNLPVYSHRMMFRITQQSNNILIQTKEGFSVLYDQQYFVSVQIPSTYFGFTEGLCGNFNKNPEDELRLPNGNIVTDVSLFGESWKVADGPNCKGCSGDQCPKCDKVGSNLAKSPTKCGMIADPEGPFKGCHSLVQPAIYVNSCIYDICNGRGGQEALCASLQAYTALCQEKGGNVEHWRNLTSCPLSCPPNSHYSLCTQSCAFSCHEILAYSSCSKTCFEGCECEDGYVFDGKSCVTMDKCGCVYNGRYLKFNESLLNDNCSQECTCDSSGSIICSNRTCADDERCQLLDGVRSCVSTNPCRLATCRPKETCQVQDDKAVCVPDYQGLCWAWGDPHLFTLDGKDIDFQGTCTYILSQYKGSTISRTSLEPYEITIKNNNRGSQAVSFVKSMKMKMYDTEILVQVGEFPNIQVNGVLTNLPVILQGGKLNVSRSGFTAVVEAANGIKATFDWNWYCTVTIPSSYYNSVSGLCGDFNQDPNDDQKAPNGTIINSIIDWTSEWKVYDRDPFCFDYCPGECPVCDEDKKKIFEGEDMCGMLFKENGPFRECKKTVNPNKFFSACLFDVCMMNGARSILCQALETFSTTCLNQGLRVYDWRTPSDCPKICEDKISHYNACGNACPASCADRNAPAKCTRPCVETCECNANMVLSGDKCVPISSCGCQHNGQYYEPNQSWFDENCAVLCKCDPLLGTVDCQSTSCKETETCKLSNGIQGCYPTEYSTCVSTGYHNYHTFDGKRYPFPGTCAYQLVKVTSNDSSLTPFAINVLNGHRGNTAMSFTKDVIIKVYNKTITMSKDHSQQIKVDETLVNLPYNWNSNKITSFISGINIILNTEFGITVTYDGLRNVAVNLPSTYSQAVSGLCGNNNGDPSDDFVLEDGVAARTADEFGSRWKVGQVEGCTNTCSDCPKCSAKDQELYKSEEYCGLLKKPDGPFRQCYNAIDPTPYFENCVLDACAYRGYRIMVCASIAAYVLDCQRNNSVIEPWRKPAFCGMNCPLNSHYELLGDGCPATCFGLIPPPACEPSPAEGCYCDNGFILSGKDCVPLSECGCVFENIYYKKGQEFYTDSFCQRKCTCDLHGMVNCTDTSCGPDEECKVADGLLGCHPKEQAQCIVWGDPHIITPDGLYYDFQGTCSYTLIKVRKGQVHFEVTVDNEPYGRMAVTKSVTVTVGDYAIHLQRNRSWNILINGEKFNLPCRSWNHDIWINKQGNNVFVHSKFGFVVMYDQQFYVSVKIPSSYSGLTEGLCGNYNKNPNDDLRLPNGSIVTDIAVFGNSWIAARGNSDCQGCSGDSCSMCDKAKIAHANSTTKCGMILDPEGPFKQCHQLVPAKKYYQSCLFDVCSGREGQEALCASLQTYTTLCQEQGAKVGTWRNITSCPLACPDNSHYEICSRTCDFTCYGLLAANTCSEKCFEGCQCDVGYMFDGGKCVTMDKCGCTHNGRYIKVNELVVSEDCSQNCNCQSGIVSCINASCADNEVCQLRDGVRGCQPRESQCTLSVDHHFTTFDGVSGEFPLHGSYVLSSSCNGSQDSQFRVVFGVHKCGGKDGKRSSLQVFTSHGLISVNEEREIWLNGWKLKDLPKFEDGTVKINVSEAGITIELRDKITVILKANDEIKIIAKEKIAGEVCGPCGNFNRDASDDLQLKNGEPSSDITFTIDSWAAKHLSTCMV